MSERAKVRAQLEDELRTDDSVNKFLVDYFEDVAARRSSGMTTDAKITLLIESIDVEIIREKLELYKSITSRLRGKKTRSRSSSSKTTAPQSRRKSSKPSSERRGATVVINNKKKLIADCVNKLDELEIESVLMIESSELRAWARDTRVILEKCLPGHHIAEEFSRVGPYATHKNVEELRKLLARAENAVVHDGLLSKIDSNAQAGAPAKTELTIVDARRQLPFHPYTHPRPKPGSQR